MPGSVPTADIREITELLGDAAHGFAGKTFLISGGCGFLGRYFVELLVYLNVNLLKTPCKIIVLDNLLTANDDNAGINDIPNVTFVEHNIAEAFYWHEPITHIIQAAGIASPYYYRRYPIETIEVSTLGTKNMLELARHHHVEGYLFLSSSEIYGDPDPGHIPTEESYRGNVSCLGPRACYDESKRLGETLCSIFHDRYRVPTKIVRPFNVYGPGMRERDYRVLPNFASRIVAGAPLHIYGDGRQTRTFCYITDAINGILRTLVEGTPGEAYNIGNSQPEISIGDLAREMESVLERDIGVDFKGYPDSYPPDEPMRRCPDLTKARQDLGYIPTVDLRTGLHRFLNWAHQNYTGLGSNDE